jgi:lipopolysaccharide transport system permease protein
MSAPDSSRTIEIAPTSGWRMVDLKEVWEFRELLHILAQRDVTVRYRQTILGIGWVVAQPLVTVAFFTFLFNRVARVEAGSDIPYALFTLAGLVPWNFFSAAVTSSGNSLIGSAHLISKVYFPRVIIPAAAVIAGVIDTLVMLGLLAVMMLYYGRVPSLACLLIPVVLLVSAVFALGMGLWFSAMNVEYRDVRVLIPFVLQLWMYGTPVVYPITVLPEWLRAIARLNPMTAVVETFRASLFGGPVDWVSAGLAIVVTMLVLVTGLFYFRRTERLFADVL